jgi:hypothetical protein
MSCCSSHFITTGPTGGQIGGDKHSNNTTGTGPTGGQTGGDKHSNKTTGTGYTGGQTGGDKHSNKKTGTTEFDYQYVLLFQSFYWRAYHLQFDHQ